jgi:hypothetical protein
MRMIPIQIPIVAVGQEVKGVARPGSRRLDGFVQAGLDSVGFGLPAGASGEQHGARRIGLSLSIKKMTESANGPATSKDAGGTEPRFRGRLEWRETWRC